MPQSTKKTRCTINRNPLHAKINKNKNFFYPLEHNDNGQFKTIFWIHPRSRMSITYFDDILTFDSTYLTNIYQISFCLFVRVNHHEQPTLLDLYYCQKNGLRHFNKYSNHCRIEMGINHLILL